MRIFIFFACLYCCACQMSTSTTQETGLPIDPDDTLFVAPIARGLGDGTSWQNATDDVQWSIKEANLNGKRYVLVAGGTYIPKGEPNAITGGDSVRRVHFSLLNNVTVMGGFSGYETKLNPRGRATIFSGNLGGGSNAYHVFYHPMGIGLDASAELQNVTIREGKADETSGTHGFGGGMYNDGNSPTLIDCIFVSNTVHIRGGGMYNTNSSPRLDNCFFDNNTVVDGSGAGMYNLNNSNPYLTDCTFINNTVLDGSGGGMYNGTSEGSYVTSNPKLENCDFIGNKAFRGGGISNWLNGNNVTLTNCTFTRNIATYSSSNVQYGGGGVFNADSSPKIDTCVFEMNEAENTNGGGMYNYLHFALPSQPDITGSVFIENKAALDGGGICNYKSDPRITACTFSGNTAKFGGGMCNDEDSISQLINCTFFGNSVTSRGGGIFNSPLCDLYITNCTFTDNRAVNYGGGIFYSGSGDFEIYGTIIVGNIALSYDDIDGTPSSSTDNLIGDSTNTVSAIFANVSSGKAVLRDNGGPTKTVMIRAGGLAHNQISETNMKNWYSVTDMSTVTDQRGNPRFADLLGDIGAVER